MTVRNNERDVCAVILAGGQSRRMGFNKALMKLGGQPLIALVADQARLVTRQILVSSNEPAAYAFLGLPVVPDYYSGQGPLAGLHSTMIHTPRPLFLLLACDLPRLHEELLRSLIRSAKGYDSVIPKTSDGRVHPLCALYRRTCLTTIEANLSRGMNKVTGLFQDSPLRVKWLGPEEGHFVDLDLQNLNAPEDLFEP